ncbi:MAG: cytochrome-c peroxidase [Sphingobacteriia bacterium]|nr:MAG: cytochrome-c peroxidase [Sphingobacteriia bacterium]
MQYVKTIWVLSITVLICTGWIALEKGLEPPKPVKLIVPKGWPSPVYDFSKNPLTEAGIELGRQLFYDEQLSKDGTISCGSCHQQFGAFNSYDHPLSHGINNQLTTRNAPGLFNLAWQKELMWDGAILHLDQQPLAPITAENEMGETIENVLIKLRNNPAYKKMFKASFGDETINTQRFGKALSQFLLTMISSNSKYDKVQKGEDRFNASEQVGYGIFKTKCAQCHAEPLFTDYTYRNNGVELDPYLKDLGRMAITGNAADSLKFKVPSLRNVQVSFPYAHDGRFFSLMNVFEHYRNNMQPGPTTDPLLKNKIPLSNFEIGQLRAFLYTLTDSMFLKDPKFAAPTAVITNIPPLDSH